MISIPKYYGIEAQSHMETRGRAGGFYRAVLTGPDERVKYDSGWKKNQVLDTGIYYILSSERWAWALYYGTSNVAANASQTGLQGTLIPRIAGGGGGDYIWHESPAVTYSNSGAPLYRSSVTEQWISEAGENTGTIGEFVLTTDTWSELTQAGIRVALDTPIVKGAQDVLTMQYRFDFYPDLTDTVGVVDISGEPYNYTLRRANVQYAPSGFDYQSQLWVGAYSYFKMIAYTGEIGTIIQDPSDVPGNTEVDRILESTQSRTGLIMSTGGSLGSYYRTLGGKAYVDDLNGTFRSIYFQFNNGVSGCQVRLGKVSDDSAFTKLNTHEFTLSMRLSIAEYTP